MFRREALKVLRLEGSVLGCTNLELTGLKRVALLDLGGLTETMGDRRRGTQVYEWERSWLVRLLRSELGHLANSGTRWYS